MKEEIIELDEEQLNRLVQTALSDFGATAQALLVVIGDKLGLYEALVERHNHTEVFDHMAGNMRSQQSGEQSS